MRPAPEAPPAEDVSLREISTANLVDLARRGAGLVESAAKGLGALARGLVSDPVGIWGEAWSTVTSIGRVAAVPESALSPVLVGRGTTYRFAAFSMPFSGIRAAAKAEDMSVNDAFLAAVALGAGGRSMPVLLGGAAVAGVVGVAVVHGIARHTRLPEDAAMGAVLSVFFGLGFVVLSYIQTLGTGAD